MPPEPVTLLVFYQEPNSSLVEILVLLVLLTPLEPVTQLATTKDFTPLLFQPLPTELPPLPLHVMNVQLELYHANKPLPLLPLHLYLPHVVPDIIWDHQETVTYVHLFQVETSPPVTLLLFLWPVQLDSS
jgi:hypothetical protein